MLDKVNSVLIVPWVVFSVLYMIYLGLFSHRIRYNVGINIVSYEDCMDIDMKKIVKNRVRKNSHTLIMFNVWHNNEKSYIGYITYHYDYCNKHTFIDELIITESMQRHGYGRMLFNEFKQNLKYRCLKLESVPSAKAFWKKMGFIEIPNLSYMMSTEKK